jgi:hypothetical protein
MAMATNRCPGRSRGLYSQGGAVVCAAAAPAPSIPCDPRGAQGPLALAQRGASAAAAPTCCRAPRTPPCCGWSAPRCGRRPAPRAAACSTARAWRRGPCRCSARPAAPRAARLRRQGLPLSRPTQQGGSRRTGPDPRRRSRWPGHWAAGASIACPRGPAKRAQGEASGRQPVARPLGNGHWAAATGQACRRAPASATATDSLRLLPPDSWSHRWPECCERPSRLSSPAAVAATSGSGTPRSLRGGGRGLGGLGGPAHRCTCARRLPGSGSCRWPRWLQRGRDGVPACTPPCRPAAAAAGSSQGAPPHPV